MRKYELQEANMLTPEQAVLSAISELATNNVRPYCHNVPDQAARILVREGGGTITLEEAFQQIKPAIVSLSQSGKIEASLDPKVTWKVNESALKITAVKTS